MERAVLLRSLSSTSTLAGARMFCRSLRRLARLSSKRHRLIPKTQRRSLLPYRDHLPVLSTISHPPSLSFRRDFSSPFSSVRAIATSAPQSTPEEAFGADDDASEKLGFDKVSEQFIEECRSRAVLYKHRKTGAEIMSVSNDDENKCFAIVFRTPPFVLLVEGFYGNSSHPRAQCLVWFKKVSFKRTIC